MWALSARSCLPCQHYRRIPVTSLVVDIQGFVQQPVQAEHSTTDSDICSNDSTADSDLVDSDSDELSGVVAIVAKPDQTVSPRPPALLRRSTLVQHAAAATIQRSFRQKIATTHLGAGQQPYRVPSDLTPAGSRQSLHELNNHKQQKAASCIQKWWRLRMKQQRHVPWTPPSTNNQPTMRCSSMQSSRPDSAASSSLSGKYSS